MEAKRLLVFSIPHDLNRATPADLCLIPGIGESLAGEVIAHRERRRGQEVQIPQTLPHRKVTAVGLAGREPIEQGLSVPFSSTIA